VTWPRLPRRICKRPSCGQRCKKPNHVYHSQECRILDKRPKVRLCPICRERPITGRNAKTKKTCGREFGCSGVMRAQTVRTLSPHRFEVGLRTARQRARVNFLKRLVGYLKTELVALNAASAPVDQAAVLSRIYHKGKADGASAAYYRYVVKPQREPQRRRA